MQGKKGFLSPVGVAPDKIESDKSEINVLVINSCQEMAKEINLELMRTFIGAAITYAPTFKLAKMMLLRKNFDLVVSSSRMPDGGVQSLQETLNSKTSPPQLVVIGDARSTKSAPLVSGYLFSSIRKISQPEISRHIRPLASDNQTQQSVQDSIQNLGADLRNDLNNPLQEIVAMAYVAKSQADSSEVSREALDAITRAATNLSSVVKGIEQKIRMVVSG